jgi:hypothetical protein
MSLVGWSVAASPERSCRSWQRHASLTDRGEEAGRGGELLGAPWLICSPTLLVPSVPVAM